MAQNDERMQAGETIESRNDLHILLDLMRQVLSMGEYIPSDGKYANSTACLAALARGYHDSLAALDLCFFSQYVQARGLMRSIYEAGSIARTFAHSPKQATEWMNGKWQPDIKARQFVANVMFRDADPEEQKNAKQAYDDAYRRLSAWTHITAESSLLYLNDDPQGGYQVQLEPEYNEVALESTLTALELETLYLTFAARNCFNETPLVLGSSWYKALEEVANRIAPSYTPSGTDWDDHDRLREQFLNNLQPPSLLNRDLKKSKNSYSNLANSHDHRRDG